MACHACCAENEEDTVVFAQGTPSDQAIVGNEAARTESPLSRLKDAGPKQPGEPCTSRLPVIGDLVLCKDENKMVGHDLAGVEEAWVLHPGQLAEVMGVDADGDFRLRNDAGHESGFLFRKDFVFVAQEGSQTQPSILVEGKRHSVAMSDTKSQRSSHPMLLSSEEKKRLESGPAFTVELQRVIGEKVGLCLDWTLPDALGIKSLDEGMVRRHNETAPDNLQILPGHFVLAVNNCKDKDLMVKEMINAQNITLLLASRKTFAARIVKNPELGLHMAHCQGGSLLLIHEVIEGGAGTSYNATAAADDQLRNGDLIEEVNGVKGDATAMMQEIKNTDELKLVVARPLR